MKKKVLAFILMALMVCQLGVCAFADDSTCTETVKISNNDVTAPSNPETYGITDEENSVNVDSSTITNNYNAMIVTGSTVNIKNSSEITALYYGGIAINANSSTVTIDNSTVWDSGSNSTGIKADNSTVTVENKSTIRADNEGSIGIKADNSTVTVKDSTGLLTGRNQSMIVASNNSTVNSNDSKITAKWVGCTGISATDSNVTANGSDIQLLGEGSTGISATDSNVTANGSDIQLLGKGSTGIRATNSNVTAIDSTITGADGVAVYGAVDGTVIVLDSEVVSTGANSDNAALKVGLSENTTADQVTIIVDKLEVDGDAALIKATNSSGKDVTEDVAKNIYYIVNTIENATVTGTKDKVVGETTYTVANEGNELTVKMADGYELVKEGQYATMKDNGDGTYTVTVNRGGDLYFSARVKVVPAAETTPVTPVNRSSSGSSSSDSSSNSTSKAVINADGSVTASAAAVARGKWVQSGNNSWNFVDANNKLVQNEWKFIPVSNGSAKASWFYLGPNGTLLTGWQKIKDSDGITRWYYLNPVSDGSLGACYINCKTPDGYTVNEKGQWTVNGVVQTVK